MEVEVGVDMDEKYGVSSHASLPYELYHIEIICI